MVIPFACTAICLLISSFFFEEHYGLTSLAVGLGYIVGHITLLGIPSLWVDALSKLILISGFVAVVGAIFYRERFVYIPLLLLVISGLLLDDLVFAMTVGTTSIVGWFCLDHVFRNRSGVSEIILALSWGIWFVTNAAVLFLSSSASLAQLAFILLFSCLGSWIVCFKKKYSKNIMFGASGVIMVVAYGQLLIGHAVSELSLFSLITLTLFPIIIWVTGKIRHGILMTALIGLVVIGVETFLPNDEDLDLSKQQQLKQDKSTENTFKKRDTGNLDEPDINPNRLKNDTDNLDEPDVNPNKPKNDTDNLDEPNNTNDYGYLDDSDVI